MRSKPRSWQRLLLAALVVAVTAVGLFNDTQPVHAAPAPPAVSGAPAPSFDFTSRMVLHHSHDADDAMQVRVGDTHYDLQVPLPTETACAQGVWVLVLSRADLNRQDSLDLPLCTRSEVDALGARLGKLKASSLVVVNSYERTEFDQRPPPALNLSKALESLNVGRYAFDYVDLHRTAFSVLGVPHGDGQAQYAKAPLSSEPTSGTSPAGVTGRLMLVRNLAQRGYGLVHLDYATYDVSTDSAITLDGHTYPKPTLPPGFGGYRVLVVDRRTLAKLSDRLYDTHSELMNQIKLERDLLKLSAESSGSVIVFLMTFGNPINPTPLPRTSGLSDACHPDENLAFAVTCTYHSTGEPQTFSVPRPIGSVQPDIEVTLEGGSGGANYSGTAGGTAARMSGVLHVGGTSPVRPGSKLDVEVGGAGQAGGYCKKGQGGYNGGGDGGEECPYAFGGYPGGGGGGATDLRTIANWRSSRIAIAAGGGGAGGTSYDRVDAGAGGAAGKYGATSQESRESHPTGRDGVVGGAPGTGTDGGAPGPAGQAGAWGVGGTGAAPVRFSGAGGGGGGGHFGGGGGGHRLYGGGLEYGGSGGGGGSSLLPEGWKSQSPTGRSEAVLTFLSTYGPTLGDVLRRFGARPIMVQRISAKTPRYVLVASPSPRPVNKPSVHFAASEVSQAADPAATGELQGVLGRGNDMAYGPVAANAVRTVTTNGGKPTTVRAQYAVFDLLAHDSAPFPYTAHGDQPRDKAFTYLSSQLCRSCDDDVRTTYAGSDVDTEYADIRDRVKPPEFTKQTGYTRADWDAVKTQVEQELRDALHVGGQQLQLKLLLTDVKTDIVSESRTVTAAFKRAFPTSDAQGQQAVDVFKLLLNLVNFVFPTDTIKDVLGGLNLVGAQLATTSSLLSSVGGDPTLTSRVDQLVDTATKSFNVFEQEQNDIFSMVYGNWGMLHAYGVATENGADLKPVYDDVKAALESDQTVSFYKSLIPVYYRMDEAPSEPGYYEVRDKYVYFYQDRTTSGGARPMYLDKFSAYYYDTNPTGGTDDARTQIMVMLPTIYAHAAEGDGLSASLLKDMREAGVNRADMMLNWPMGHCVHESWRGDVTCGGP